MYSYVFGHQIDLTLVTIFVAFYDLFHIGYELKQRFVSFNDYEDTDFGCLNELFQAHCVAIYGEIGIYVVDLIFTCFLIYGASKLKTIPVLCWLVLSAYHLVDFLLLFTPFYGDPLLLRNIVSLMWLDLGCSTLGFLFVIYFYKKLVEIEKGEIVRERLSNVDDMKISGVDLEAYSEQST